MIGWPEACTKLSELAPCAEDAARLTPREPDSGLGAGRSWAHWAPATPAQCDCELLKIIVYFFRFKVMFVHVLLGPKVVIPFVNLNIGRCYKDGQIM